MIKDIFSNLNEFVVFLAFLMTLAHMRNLLSRIPQMAHLQCDWKKIVYALHDTTYD